MATEPSKSETQLLDSAMDVDPLSDSVTHINLSGILNKSIQLQPEAQTESPVDDTLTLTQATNFIEVRGKRLRAALTIIAKASHHKAFMETCLLRNSSPRNMSLWVQPHIYHSNPDVEKQWKDTLHQASLNLTTTLVQHYTRVIKAEQETLEKIKQDMTEYLTKLNGTTREEEILKWREQSKKAEEEARNLSENLKESRESKLFRKRKRTESQQNLIPSTSKQVLLPTPKQPHLQQSPPTDFMEALTGLISTYSKNGPPEQRRQYQQHTYQQPQQPNRGKGPAKGKGFPHLKTDIKETNNIQKKNRHRQKLIQTNTISHNTNHDNIDCDRYNNPIINHTIDTKDDDSLVILAKQTTLTDSQKSVLRKGLKFIPKPKSLPIQTLHTDIRNFMHRLKTILYELRTTNKSQKKKYTEPKDPFAPKRKAIRQWYLRYFST